jgi:hypothetical protein
MRNTMARQCRWAWALLLGGILLGCGRVPEEPPGTGAKECAQTFFEALIHRDLPKAYAALDPQSQTRCSSQQFSVLAQRYHTNLGFAPQEVQVWACEERGTEAIAHVVLTGRTTIHHRRYKDAVTLRRTDHWRVVMPSNFGHAR